MATARAVPFAVAVSRRFAHITGGGLRGLAAVGWKSLREEPTGDRRWLLGLVWIWQFRPGDDLSYAL